MTLITWIKQRLAIRRKEAELRKVNEHIRWLDDQIESGQIVRKQYMERRAILSAELNSILPADQIVRNAGVA